MNPYLPEWEYLPDGEPHVFGDRVYVYGSHDAYDARMFCIKDYTCWSAPVDDLSDWRCESTIYKKNQDPANRMGLRLLFAPDVAQGADGRFFLYYAYDFLGQIGVAVADEPAGPYEFYGHVSWPDGTAYGRKQGDGFPFDPAVLVDTDGSVYLYSGFYTPVPAIASGFHRGEFGGGYMVRLEHDMLTITGNQKLLFPKEGPGSFAGHEFFEASSIRRFGDTYVFVYSSRLNHELCYATSDRPDGGFSYGGTLISIGDVGLPGHPDETHAANYTGNTHGGILHLPDPGDSDPFGGHWYISYHRQTNRTSYSRQACMEPLRRDTSRPGLHFLQAELTSCGLNDGSLAGTGVYPARIACNLWSAEGAARVDVSGSRHKLANHPSFRQTRKDGDASARQYIDGMRDGAVAGFKYFDLSGTTGISLTTRGDAGNFVVATDEEFTNVLGVVPLEASCEWRTFSATLAPDDDNVALFLRYFGSGRVDLLELELR